MSRDFVGHLKDCVGSMKMRRSLCLASGIGRAMGVRIRDRATGTRVRMGGRVRGGWSGRATAALRLHLQRANNTRQSSTDLPPEPANMLQDDTMFPFHSKSNQVKVLHEEGDATEMPRV